MSQNMDTAFIGSFASLDPHNIAAIRLASTVYDRIREDSTYAHHLKTFGSTGQRVPIRELLQAQESSPESRSPTIRYGSSESEATVPDEDPMNELVWPTRYKFTFSSTTLSPRLGWIAGYGHRWNKQNSGKVDLLLAVDSDSHNNSEVKSIHARFNFFSPSGQFGIVRGRDNAFISVDGEQIGRQPFLLLQHREQITLGSLEYRFSYLVEQHDQQRFQLAKNNHLVHVLSLPLPNSLSSITPSIFDEHIGRWTLLQTLGAGTESVVRAAVSRNGHTGTVVRMEYYRKSDKERTDKYINAIKKITRRIRETDAAGRDCIIQFFDNFLTSSDAMYIVTTPLGFCDFTSPLFRENESYYQEFFAQAVLGIEALHQSGFLHGDIKMMNLVVVSFTPPRAVVIDIAGATDMRLAGLASGLLAKPGQGGTVGYLAPEREASERCRYSFPSDIWSLGTVGMQIFSSDPFAPFPGPVLENPFHEFDLAELDEPLQDVSSISTRHFLRNSARKALEQLKHDALRDPAGIDSLLAAMLELRPDQRITARDACSHPFIVGSRKELEIQIRGKRRRS